MQNLENKKPKKTRFFDYYMIFYFVMSLSAFVIPIDILDRSEICANFVNFMKQFFPNIEVFGSVSKIPQYTEFYVSFMWIWGLGIVVVYCFLIDLNRANKKVGVLFLKSILVAIFCFIIAFLGTKNYFFGNVALKPATFGARTFTLDFATKFSNFIWINFFQVFFFSVGCFLAISGVVWLIFGIKNLKK
ncbi:hypothetical protein OFO03_06810 [Campylobacter sp. JMF_02 ED1]|uniref:hypothetical protein n=1 Tax=unclassified Campylobacter TaxID=2593542 RepID=UPI0022E9FA2D|nr:MULTISPECIES: hypothetical protein [unclassified Campylobacter]MDA3050177.1 hypothetical protein [Campylobacter sp. JMF_15 NE4]MDA3051608.1 hypothetical protein [Campylobacter sp. JMF_02 ED1]